MTETKKKEKEPQPIRPGGLPHDRRRTVYLIAAGSWITGLLWVIFHFFMSVEDEFGFDTVHPLEKWWLTFHAVFFFCALWMFGVLWPNHVKINWRMKRRRWSGGLMYGIVIWLAISGFLMLYLGDEKLRNLSSWAHWLVGLAALIAFTIHLSVRWFGKKEGEARPSFFSRRK